MRNKIIIGIVAAWIVFSVGYIAHDLWSNYKNGQLVAAYQQGKTDTINALIQAAESSCNPIPVVGTSTQIAVMNADCQSTSSSK